jgi:uncharacterized membrane protein YhaH (DUF805 family)
MQVLVCTGKLETYRPYGLTRPVQELTITGGASATAFFSTLTVCAGTVTALALTARRDRDRGWHIALS